MQRRFTGLEIRGNRLVLSPNWPESLGALGFPIHYRGLHMHVRVGGKGAEVSVHPRDVPPVVIECRGRVEQLAPGCTIRFPNGPTDGLDLTGAETLTGKIRHR